MVDVQLVQLACAADHVLPPASGGEVGLLPVAGTGQVQPPLARHEAVFVRKVLLHVALGGRAVNPPGAPGAVAQVAGRGKRQRHDAPH